MGAEDSESWNSVSKPGSRTRPPWVRISAEMESRSESWFVKETAKAILVKRPLLRAIEATEVVRCIEMPILIALSLRDRDFGVPGIEASIDGVCSRGLFWIAGPGGCV